MGTDTKLRPDRTKLPTGRRMAPPAPRRGVRTALWVLALVGVVAVALVVAVLVNTGPTGSEFPPPGTSPVQAERRGTVEQLTPAEQQELQRFRNAVDVDRLTLDAPVGGVAAAHLVWAEDMAAARAELRAMQATVREVPSLRGVLHDDMVLLDLVGSGQIPVEALDEAR